MAFIDIGSQDLKLGDVVKVILSDASILYLEAVEVSPILSKLAPSRQAEFAFDPVAFQKMAVGNRVVKLEPSVAIAGPLSAPNSLSAGHQPTAVAADSLSEDELIKAIEKIKQLEAMNQSFKDDILWLSTEKQTLDKKNIKHSQEIGELKDLIAALKTKLENMQEIINANEPKVSSAAP